MKPTKIAQTQSRPQRTGLRLPIKKLWPALPLFALVALLVSVITGCQSPQASGTTAQGAASTPAAADGPAVPVTPATQLAEGDVIQVTFEAETNMNSVAKVDLDGSVVLPMVGRVQAAGKTLQQFQTDLGKDYERFIKMTDMHVTLVSSSACVYVSGAVLRPGRIPLTRPITALEAIMEAGGFDPNRAKPAGTVVLRLENGERKRYIVNLKTAMNEGETRPFQLKPFDVIHVPEKTFNF